jgi:hypothetical protein
VLKLGPSWWFHDSPEGMMRFREQVTETAGFYNTVGFNDDTRAFLSIPARHDVARRVDSAFLARMVAEHRMDEVEAAELIVDLTYNLPKKAYKLDQRPDWARPTTLRARRRIRTPFRSSPMFTKTYHATHPDMMFAVSNDDLRERYLMDGLFAADEIVLTTTTPNASWSAAPRRCPRRQAARPDRARLGRRPPVPGAPRAGRDQRRRRQGQDHRRRRRLRHRAA